MGYLYKSVDENGRTMFTTARDENGKPVTDVQLTGSSVQDGEKNITTAGTAEQLTTDTPSRSVLIKAKSSNTGVIRVGSTSTPLYPIYADEGIAVQVDNLNKIYVDADVSGEGVIYFAEV